MKFRKLLLSAKLKQIQKENQNIFVFHCSLNAIQWRIMKNYLNNRNLLAMEKVSVKFAGDQEPEISQSTKGINTLRQDPSPSGLTFKIFFSPFDRRPPALLAPPLGQEHKESAEAEGLLPSKATGPTVPRTDSAVGLGGRSLFLKENAPKARRTDRAFSSRRVALGGCLLFFDQSNFQKKSNSFRASKSIEVEVLKTLSDLSGVLESNQNFLFLYGRMDSTILNHIDLKKTCCLDAGETYQQLILSLQMLSNSLNSCLNQTINEFCSIQEARLLPFEVCKKSARPQSGPSKTERSAALAPQTEEIKANNGN